MSKSVSVKAEKGKVWITYPYTETDRASGYPYDTTRSCDLSPEDAQSVSDALGPAIEQARQQRSEIKKLKREKLESELAALGPED